MGLVIYAGTARGVIEIKEQNGDWSVGRRHFMPDWEVTQLLVRDNGMLVASTRGDGVWAQQDRKGEGMAGGWAKPPSSRFRSETEALLRRFRRPNAGALQFEHPHLRRRAAGRREAADLAARGQHPVTGDDQWRRIPGHRLADVARRLAARANLLRQRSVGGRAAPANSA